MQKLFSFLYPVLYALVLILYFPYLLWRSFRERRRIHFWDRLQPPRSETAARTAQGIWIHAVSVGEVNAIRPLAEHLSTAGITLWISTGTETGQAQARRLFEGKAGLFYFPLDWKSVCRRYLKNIRPSMVLLTETELWPSFLKAAQELAIPVVLINGRISNSSFRRYSRFPQLTRTMLRAVTCFCMQSRQDKERVIKLGAEPSRVYLPGSLKFDYELVSDPAREDLATRVEQILRTDANSLIWVCGSTREGEEEVLIRVFADLRGEYPDLRLVLAPRHPHRAEVLRQLIDPHRLTCLFRSQSDQAPPPSGVDVFVLDSLGELSYIYRVADVVFLGGSLVATGGHNMIEAAYFGKPIIVGPYMDNFKEISELFLTSYAALQVQSAAELGKRLRELLKDANSRSWLGRNARRVVMENQGALRRTLELINTLLAENHDPASAITMGPQRRPGRLQA
ncbi:MAG: 3-deoxy-D-manno-octulosonic acid transferase [Acidobacteria bacterium]|nr:3-deoxy-D-manno-octulosonic acid transferase [Acidobacteriota bacterium]